jgi:hypothetical protein
MGVHCRAAAATRDLPHLENSWSDFGVSPGSFEKNIEKMQKNCKKYLFNREEMEYNKMALS